MHPFPHRYVVSAASASPGSATLTADALPALESAPPPEFDGPGGLWSPESLLVAAVADCFILTFHSIARVTRFEWTSLQCRVEGLLERVAGVTQFTRFTTHARLVAPPGVDRTKAREHLERAEKLCLISNSLRGERVVEIEIAEAG